MTGTQGQHQAENQQAGQPLIILDDQNTALTCGCASSHRAIARGIWSRGQDLVDQMTAHRRQREKISSPINMNVARQSRRVSLVFLKQRDARTRRLSLENCTSLACRTPENPAQKGQPWGIKRRWKLIPRKVTVHQQSYPLAGFPKGQYLM